MSTARIAQHGTNGQTAALNRLAVKIRNEHAAFLSAIQPGLEAALRPGLNHARRAGELLLEARKQFAHGQWQEWVETHCGFSTRSAQVYLQVVKRLPKAQCSAGLSLTGAVKLLAPVKRRARSGTKSKTAKSQSSTYQVWQLIAACIKEVNRLGPAEGILTHLRKANTAAHRKWKADQDSPLLAGVNK